MILEHSVSSVFVGEFLTVTTSVDNEKPSQDLDCVDDYFRLILA
jgi:hypothetical protein